MHLWKSPRKEKQQQRNACMNYSSKKSLQAEHRKNWTFIDRWTCVFILCCALCSILGKQRPQRRDTLWSSCHSGQVSPVVQWIRSSGGCGRGGLVWVRFKALGSRCSVYGLARARWWEDLQANCEGLVKSFRQGNDIIRRCFRKMSLSAWRQGGVFLSFFLIKIWEGYRNPSEKLWEYDLK